jgi:hypothetical protein
MRAIFALPALLAAFLAQPALAMSCGPRFVNEGMTTYQVARICGDPQSAGSRTIYVTRVEGYENLPAPPKGGAVASPVYVQIPVNIDEWVYNLGPNLLMQKLTFENDRLVGIESLGYGN